MTQWFFGCTGNAAQWFSEMIRVAVLSSRENTSLSANCLYDGEPCDLTDWMASVGVNVIFTQVPFRDELFSDQIIQANRGSTYRSANACGHFLRAVVADYASEETVIYTDCDVMFLADPKFEAPRTIAAAAEIDRKTFTPSPFSFNSGVMVLDVSHFRATKDDLISFFREHNFFDIAHGSYDQVLLNLYYRQTWTPLSADMNWRPASGINSNAQIVHFHGPKPHRVRAILDRAGIPEEAGLLDIIEHDRVAYNYYTNIFYQYLRS